MKTKLKKWHIALMSFIALFIAIFASLFSLKADTVDEETGEILTDNWELDIVFYDSTVDNGKTPLTEINWDASDGGYGQGKPREIVVQINYKNDSVITTYQPHELMITIPNLLHGYTSAQWQIKEEYLGCQISEMVVGANDPTHDKYAWTYLDGKTVAKETAENLVFYNTNIIEENTHFEGSIQIQYKIVPGEERTNLFNYIEKYENECTHIYSKNFQAILSNNTEEILSSNVLIFNYTRIYTHNWKYPNLEIEKQAIKITATDFIYDNYSNPNDYYWVQYNFILRNNFFKNYSYPYLPITAYKFEDEFPDDCVVVPKFSNDTITIEDNKHIITVAHSDIHVVAQINTNDAYGTTLIVGYPKAQYNNEQSNLAITNTVNLYASYYDNQESFTYQNQDNVSLNLADFEFSYNGNLYAISKSFSMASSYEEISGIDSILSTTNNAEFNITALYTGKPMDVKFGDDLLYVTSSDGNYRKIDYDEYYFTKVKFSGNYYNGYDESKISLADYDVELWIRVNDNLQYSLYTTFKGNTQTFSFTEDQHITGYYFIIKNLNKSIRTEPPKSGTVNRSTASIKFKNLDNILENGKIYNFAFMQIYIDGILQNEPTINSYSNFITKEEIATYDQNTYGNYIQRSCSYGNYSNYKITPSQYSININKTLSTPIQDVENEIFKGTSTISFKNSGYNNGIKWTQHEIEKYLLEDQMIAGFEFFDLLPEGMKLTSTKEEILNTFKYCTSNFYSMVVYDKNGKQLTQNEVQEILKNGMTLEVIENHNNTNRTFINILINFEDTPLVIKCKDHGLWYNSSGLIEFSYNYEISYDSYLEYGNYWENSIYWNYYNRSNSSFFYTNNSYSLPKDSNGNIIDTFDQDMIDINFDNEEDWSYFESSSSNKYAYYYTSKFSGDTASIIITSVVSTHQDITTYVKTDQSNYSTGIVDVSCNSEYEYKLRVRTGSADVTNLVIYTSIEEAQPKRTRWYGEFLGIDTTYAENKGYTVKVWYSPNKTVGTLTEDTSWLEYDETTVDKSMVKSLAFQYLVETDNTTGTSIDTIDPAVLPANSLTYVLIKMKAPTDESIKTLARMDCWTQWNALDDYDRPVDFITGINSNIVKVALPNSIKEDSNPSISLKFIKEMNGTSAEFENMKLDMAAQQTFMIRLTSLTANEDGSYNQVTALLKSNQELIISQIPVGTYLLEELGDNYFDFVEFADNNDPEIVINGVTFEQTDQGYIITVSESLTENVEFNIQVINEIEPERFYEDKDNKENLFLKNKIEEDA